MRSWRQSLCLGIALLLLARTAGPVAAQDACFTAAQNGRLPFEVVQQAPPPRAGEQGYRYYPLTAATTMNLDSLWAARDSQVRSYFFLWANRCNAGDACRRGTKGNVVDHSVRTRDPETRAFFSSFVAADSCTLAQAARLLGFGPDRIAGYAARSGIKLVDAGDRALQGAVGQISGVCVLPNRPLPENAAGIVLDYEVQDNRAPEVAAGFLRDFAALVRSRGKQSILFTNPLDVPNQRRSGLEPGNLNTVAQNFDAITVLLWGGNRQGDLASSFASQMQALGGFDPRRILVGFELARTTLEDARTVNALIRRNGFRGVILWRNRAEQGGSCALPVNRKITCLVFDQCR